MREKSQENGLGCLAGTFGTRRPVDAGRYLLSCLQARLPRFTTPAGHAARGPAGEVGGQAGGSPKIVSVSWLNQGEMFISHLWASNEFQFKPHRPRNP